MSKRVAKIAGRILAIKLKRGFGSTGSAEFVEWNHGCGEVLMTLKLSDIRALATSALTHAQDHAERETLRAGRLPRGHRRVKTHAPVRRRMLHK